MSIYDSLDFYKKSLGWKTLNDDDKFIIDDPKSLSKVQRTRYENILTALQGIVNEIESTANDVYDELILCIRKLKSVDNDNETKSSYVRDQVAECIKDHISDLVQYI